MEAKKVIKRTEVRGVALGALRGRELSRTALQHCSCRARRCSSKRCKCSSSLLEAARHCRQVRQVRQWCLPQIVLAADVKGLGSRGDIAKATYGYFRNFLQPQKLAVPLTDNYLQCVPGRCCDCLCHTADLSQHKSCTAGSLTGKRRSSNRSTRGEWPRLRAWRLR